MTKVLSQNTCTKLFLSLFLYWPSDTHVKMLYCWTKRSHLTDWLCDKGAYNYLIVVFGYNVIKATYWYGFSIRRCFSVNILSLYSQCLGTVGLVFSHESWNMIPTRALFNHLLSFCPIDLHCEPFNYTIHHLLNMKNGVKCTLIKPLWKVFCKGPINQANGLWALHVCKHVYCRWVFFPFFHVWPSIVLNTQQQADGG